MFFINKTIIQYLSTADIGTFIVCTFIVRVCLPWQRRYGKHLKRMSDKCNGGGIIWPRADFGVWSVFVSPSSLSFCARFRPLSSYILISHVGQSFCVRGCVLSSPLRSLSDGQKTTNVWRYRSISVAHSRDWVVCATGVTTAGMGHRDTCPVA